MPISRPATFDAAQRRHPEDRERHQRLLGAQLDQHERDQQGERQRDERDGLGRAPARRLGVHQRIDQDRQAGGHRHGARDVEGAGLAVEALVEQLRGKVGGEERDRGVHEQHPFPAEVLGENAAEQHAGRATRARDRAPHAQRLVALGALLEGVGHDRERGGGDDRGAEALERARNDQLDVTLREPARQRRDAEEDQARDEHPPPAEQVGHAPAEQQEAAEDQHVGVHHPGQVVLGEVEVLADRGQGDVHDRRVEHHDELNRGEEGEGEGLGAG